MWPLKNHKRPKFQNLEILVSRALLSHNTGGVANLPGCEYHQTTAILELFCQLFSGEAQGVAVHVARQKSRLEGNGDQRILVADGVMGERGLRISKPVFQQRQHVLLPSRRLRQITGSSESSAHG